MRRIWELYADVQTAQQELRVIGTALEDLQARPTAWAHVDAEAPVYLRAYT